MLNKVLIPCGAASCSPATPALLAVFGSGSALYIAHVRYGYHHILLLYQVFHAYLIIHIGDLRLAGIAKLLFHFYKLILYDLEA